MSAVPITIRTSMIGEKKHLYFDRVEKR
jgi:hypothetical protein